MPSNRSALSPVSGFRRMSRRRRPAMGGPTVRLRDFVRRHGEKIMTTIANWRKDLLANFTPPGKPPIALWYLFPTDSEFFPPNVTKAAIRAQTRRLLDL